MNITIYPIHSKLDQYFFALVSIIVIMFSAHKSTAQESVPACIDLSSTKYFPPIENQGYIAACDWFAVIYYQMTFLYNKQFNRAASLDNTFSPKFGYNFLNNASIYPYNIRVDDVYKFVQKHGSATMSELPYDMAAGTGFMEWCTDAKIWENALNYRTNGYSYFTYKNTAAKADYSFDDFSKYLFEIKKLLSEGEILVVQTNTVEPGKSLYKVINNDTSTVDDDKYVGEQILYSGNNGPDHTMAVVGYNDHIWVDLNNDGIVQPEEKGALKIADSYGLNIMPNRNNGFIWMLYSTVESSIFEHRVNRMNIRSNYKPKITCKITLNTSQRDKLRFQFGRSDSNNGSDIPKNDTLIFDPYGLGFNTGTAGVSLLEGGACAFDGGKEAHDGSFVFDLTDIYNNNRSQYWYLRISNSGTDTAIIKSFEINDTEKGCIAKDNGLPYKLINQEVFRFVALENTSATVSGNFIKSIDVFITQVFSMLTVTTGRDLSGGVIKITNLDGQVMLSRKIYAENKITLNMRSFLSGAYIVMIVDKNRLVRYSKRVFK